MLTFYICFFGYIVSIRLFSALFFRFHLKKKLMDWVFCVLLVFDLMLIFFSAPPIFVWGWHFILFLLLFLSPKAIELFLEGKLRNSAVIFLDQIILTVQAGASLRTAIKYATDQETGWRHHELLKAYSSLILADEPVPLRSDFLQELFSELRWIDQTRARVLEQIKSLRWHYKVQEDFRRKSGQVSQQSRIQAIVVSILYVALLIFNVYHFGFFKNMKLIGVSFCLFTAGLILVFAIGRRIKWKV